MISVLQPSYCNHIMQELMVVDVKLSELKAVISSPGYSTISRAAFAPDCQSFVVGWCSYEDFSESTCRVYSQSCQLTTSFDDRVDSWDPSWAMLEGNKMAIAQKSYFKIWDLASGHLHAAAGPDPTPSNPCYQDPGGLLAVNTGQHKLAFCPVVGNGSPIQIHVYDSHSLQPLACLKGEWGIAPMDYCAGASSSSSLFWGLHGWMLAYAPSCNSFCGRLQIMAPLEGSCRYQHASMQGCEPQQPPALSPCSSFVVLFEEQRARLEIRDLRSGDLVVSQAVRLARDAQTKPNMHYDLALRWSSCGTRVVARVRAVEVNSSSDCWAAERIVVMQIL